MKDVPSCSGILADPVVGSYNVHKCVGIDGRFDPERTLAVIAEMNVDILALQEADARFGERRPLMNCAALTERCGLFPVPLAGPIKGSGWHGNKIFLREGLVRDVHPIALPSLEPRGALMVTVELPAGPLCIVATHLGLLRRSRVRQAEAILRRVVRAAGDLPILLLGDLNEWRMGPRSSLVPLKRVFASPSGTVASFPSRLPVLPLDRILGRPGDLIEDIAAHDTPLARLASDHLPVKARLSAGRLAAGIEAPTVSRAQQPPMPPMANREVALRRGNASREMTPA